MTFRSVLLLLALGAASGCASASSHGSSVPEPAACRDSLYLDLRAQPPDSLSAREWERFRSLDRECSAARSHDASARDGMMGMGHSSGHWAGRGVLAFTLMVLIMAVAR